MKNGHIAVYMLELKLEEINKSYFTYRTELAKKLDINRRSVYNCITKYIAVGIVAGHPGDAGMQIIADRIVVTVSYVYVSVLHIDKTKYTH